MMMGCIVVVQKCGFSTEIILVTEMAIDTTNTQTAIEDKA
jgi:hypothetical protein